MKRGLAARSRRGSPPLPRQRKALRAVQITLAALAAGLGFLAYRSWQSTLAPVSSYVDASQSATLGQIFFLGAVALAALVAAVVMGLKIVRGPRPPELD